MEYRATGEASIICHAKRAYIYTGGVRDEEPAKTSRGRFIYSGKFYESMRASEAL